LPHKKINMKTKAELIASLRKQFKQTGLIDDSIADKLRDIREYTKTDGDPLVTKILRLAAEYIEANKSFEIEIIPVYELGDATDEEEETEEPEIELEPEIVDLEHLLQLVEAADNKFNREELAVIKNTLLELV